MNILNCLGAKQKVGDDMPKVVISKQQEQMTKYSRTAEGSMRDYMVRNGISEETLAKKWNVDIRTVQNRIKNPGSMRLRDLWQMSIIMGCPLGEIAGGDKPEELIGKWMLEASRK